MSSVYISPVEMFTTVPRLWQQTETAALKSPTTDHEIRSARSQEVVQTQTLSLPLAAQISSTVCSAVDWTWVNKRPVNKFQFHSPRWWNPQYSPNMQYKKCPGARPPLRGKYLQQTLGRNTAASWRRTDIPARCFWEMVTHMECAQSFSLFKSGGFSPFLVFGTQSSTWDRESTRQVDHTQNQVSGNMKP